MQYEVKALRGVEGLTLLKIDAANADEAIAQAKSRGYSVISAQSMSQWPTVNLARKPRFPLVMFSQELMTLLNAGLSLIEVLEALEEKEDQIHAKKMLQQLIASLYQGHSISDALEQLPEEFPPLVRGDGALKRENRLFVGSAVALRHL